MFNPMSSTDAVKEMLKRILLVRLVGELNAMLPFGDRFGVDAVLLGQRSYARLTTLDCSMNCLYRRGAAV
jgi:hypothetical protein